MDGLSKLPADVTLGPLSKRVFSVLEAHTAFPWPVLVAQCRRYGYDPADLSVQQLTVLIPQLASGVERFTSPVHGREVAQALTALVRVHR